MAGSLEEVVQRGHPFGIVDEVDNILIDEARTPLIISGAPEEAGRPLPPVRAARAHAQGRPEDATRSSEARHADGAEPDYDYEYDEKHKTVAPTERGVAKAEKFLGIENMYLSEHGNLVNHLIQALKAESLYKRDKEYAVIDGEVKIIDEFTGRILEGRRWSEGLHQAVEAKEGVVVREENQTLATVTLQNYFRLYDKLAGMTGTALTEANEFIKIYKLPVVDIPTNQPMVRADHNDQIYKTKDGKWKAVLDEIKARHEAGQPVLVGTISVEVSEMLSERPPEERRQARRPEREARARPARGRDDRRGRAARRGHDRDQHGGPRRGHHARRQPRPPHAAWSCASSASSPATSPGTRPTSRSIRRSRREVDADHEKVKELGGLFILGTERHESRRIDNQLRGRSGRQGDPGESRFFLSAEDDLVRLFAGDRIYRILDRLGPGGRRGPRAADRGQDALAHDRERAEEGRGAELPDPQARARVRRRDEPAARGGLQVPARDPRGPRHVRARQGGAARRLRADRGGVHAGRLRRGLGHRRPVRRRCARSSTRASTTRTSRSSRSTATSSPTRLHEDALGAYAEREEELGDELMRNLERAVLLQIIDERWREHLYDMDYLREGIHLRGFAQRDPLVEYKNEGFTLFRDLMNSIWEDFGRYIFHVQVEIEPAQAAAFGSSSPDAAHVQPQLHGRRSRAALGAVRRRPSRAAWRVADDGPASSRRCPRSRRATSTSKDKIGRNDPCWCGSGKKFKKCHGRVAVAETSTARESAERVAKLRDQLKLLADYL